MYSAIIVAEEKSNWRAPAVETLNNIGFDSYVFSSNDEYFHLVRNGGRWLAVVDLFMQSADGLRVAMALRSANPDLAMIAITRSIDGSNVVVPSPSGSPTTALGSSWTTIEIAKALDARLSSVNQHVAERV